ncbi:uncharacterized protein LOC113213980 [Frankliniella occidentalis]|uniref:Uncharacterized protein LOC113213980 n=1 Tax=Frankliniella occidentalis TaxID=133901 RepID=A0A9C6XC82_FRAOC|nr:uncharacterized protein LOC113213980 [Frankliniella occidentalis]
MDVGDISWSRGGDRQKEKDAVLFDAPGVTRLVDVRCQRDPEWSLQLLQRAAPSLEELSVHHPSEAHLLAVHAMPRLRRLHVTSVPAPYRGNPNIPDFAKPPTEEPRPRHALQWLRVWGLPRVTLGTLLRAHRESLEELQLSVGTAEPLLEVAAVALVDKMSSCKAEPQPWWPYNGGDLHIQVVRLHDQLPLPWRGLRALRRLVLERSSVFHDAAHCVRQLAQMRPLVDGAEVLCDKCDGVAGEEL